VVSAVRHLLTRWDARARLLPRLALVALLAGVLVSAACAGSASKSEAVPSGASYDQTTLALDPVLYLGMRPGSATEEPDLSHHLPAGTYSPEGVNRASARLPNGQAATVFDGSSWLRLQSSPILSISHAGALTIEAWVNPATLRFARAESSGYVQWLGKGASSAYEYVLRMYSLGNSEGRDNRISGYAFNLSGGKGSGAYFQDHVHVGAWIMIAVEFDTTPSAGFPSGWVAIFKDGALRQMVGLDQFGVVPRPGSAPFTVGTVTGRSFFQGSIAKVAVFDRVLPTSDIVTQYHAMVGQ